MVKTREIEVEGHNTLGFHGVSGLLRNRAFPVCFEYPYGSKS